MRIMTAAARVLFVVWEYDVFLQKIIASITRGSFDKDTVSKTTEVASSVHSSILRSRKK